MRSSRIFGLALICLTSVSMLSAQAENWPNWRGPRGDNIVQEKNLLESWPAEGPKLLWTAKVGNGYSTPIAVDGKVYFSGMNNNQETVTCLKADSGEVVWSKNYGPSRTGQYAGSRATLTYENGIIYGFSPNGVLYCISAKDGALRWQMDVLKTLKAKNIGWGASSSPFIFKNEVIVCGGIVDSPMAVAVNKQTGALLWQSETKGDSGYAPCLAVNVDGTQQLIVMGGKEIAGLNPSNGKKIWTTTFSTQYQVNAATPIYRDNLLFVTSAYGHGSMLYKLSAHGITPVWEKDNKTLQGKFPSPILDNNTLFMNSSGKLKCVSWPEFKPLWESSEYKLGEGGTILRFGDKLITFGETGWVSLVKATAEGCQTISQFEAFPKEKETWSSPIIYEGKLYLHGSNDLKCFEISSK